MDLFGVSGIGNGRARADPRQWVSVAEGGPLIALDTYRHTGRVYKRLVCQCTEHGSRCDRHKALTKFLEIGSFEPFAYLCAWNSLGGGVSLEDHRARAFEVPAALVEEWIPKLDAALINSAFK